MRILYNNMTCRSANLKGLFSYGTVPKKNNEMWILVWVLVKTGFYKVVLTNIYTKGQNITLMGQ